MGPCSRRGKLVLVTRTKLLLGVVLCAACGPKVEGGVNAVVDFVRVDTGRACIRVAVVDLASVGSEPDRLTRRQAS